MLDYLVPIVIAWLLIAILFAASELGYRVGRRSRLRGDNELMSQAATWEGALLGLLALLIGFTFAMAVSRFDARRELIRDEADAIQQTALRTDLLDEPARSEVQSLLRDYAEARVRFYEVGIHLKEVRLLQARAEGLHREIWRRVVEAARARPDDVMAQLVDAAAELATMSAKRRTALDNHVPWPVMLVLVLVAATGAAATGYSCGLHGRRHRLGMILLPFLIAVVVWLVFDLDFPRTGIIRAGQGAMFRVLQALGG